TNQNLDDAYPELVDALGWQTTPDFVIDGEIVAFAGRRTSFELLQRRMQIRDPRVAARTGVRVVFCVFDLLYVAGQDVGALPLLIRKRVLRRALTPAAA